MYSGTSEKPYLVYTAGQLNDIRNHLDSDIALVRDIDLAGYFPEGGSESEGWQPIGEYVDENQTLAYTGCFEGNGKTISNLRINSDKPYVELFGAVEGYLDGDMKPATIKNLNLVDAEVTSNIPGYVGGFVGYSCGDMSDCKVTVGGVETTGSYAGGFSGCRCGLGPDPRHLQGKVEHQRNALHPDAQLCGYQLCGMRRQYYERPGFQPW